MWTRRKKDKKSTRNAATLPSVYRHKAFTARSVSPGGEVTDAAVGKGVYLAASFSSNGSLCLSLVAPHHCRVLNDARAKTETWIMDPLIMISYYYGLPESHLVRALPLDALQRLGERDLPVYGAVSSLMGAHARCSCVHVVPEQPEQDHVLAYVYMGRNDTNVSRILMRIHKVNGNVEVVNGWEKVTDCASSLWVNVVTVVDDHDDDPQLDERHGKHLLVGSNCSPHLRCIRITGDTVDGQLPLQSLDATCEIDARVRTMVYDRDNCVVYLFVGAGMMKVVDTRSYDGGQTYEWMVLDEWVPFSSSYVNHMCITSNGLLALATDEHGIELCATGPPVALTQGEPVRSFTQAPGGVKPTSYPYRVRRWSTDEAQRRAWNAQVLLRRVAAKEGDDASKPRASPAHRSHRLVALLDRDLAEVTRMVRVSSRRAVLVGMGSLRLRVWSLVAPYDALCVITHERLNPFSFVWVKNALWVGYEVDRFAEWISVTPLIVSVLLCRHHGCPLWTSLPRDVLRYVCQWVRAPPYVVVKKSQ